MIFREGEKMIEQHGGDREGYEREYGKSPLDFSVNVSPLGLPEGVKLAVTKALDHADTYPDPLCRKLREGIGEKLGIPKEWILCGNGASDLIERFIRTLAPKKALLTGPTFSEYRQAMERMGTEILEYSLREEEDFRVGESILEAIGEDLDLLILCEPNNPTGLLTEEKLLTGILERCREKNCYLLLDECFVDFLEDGRKQGQLSYLKRETEADHILLLRAFTKFYAMAGIRLGYCISQNTALLQEMTEKGAAWPVSSLAQAAGLAALEEEEYGRRLKALIWEERDFLLKGLRALGLRVIEGKANYLLFYTKDTRLQEKLWQRGIMIRDCSNYSGLEKGWFRIGLRNRRENELLLKEMKEVLEK